MTSTKLLFISIIIFLLLVAISDNARILSRKKRYLVFPEGSTLSVSKLPCNQIKANSGILDSNLYDVANRYYSR